MDPALLESDWFDALRRIGAATAVGAIIGLDRELLGKPLGFRTLTIVSIASCALTVAAARYDLALGGVHHETVGRAAQCEVVAHWAACTTRRWAARSRA